MTDSTYRLLRKRCVGKIGVRSLIAVVLAPSGSGSVVERLLAKEKVEGSNLFFRSRISISRLSLLKQVSTTGFFVDLVGNCRTIAAQLLRIVRHSTSVDG